MDEEFAEWAAGSERSLLRTAYLLTGDLQRAEDLVQEALVKVCLRWGRLRADAVAGGGQRPSAPRSRWCVARRAGHRRLRGPAAPTGGATRDLRRRRRVAWAAVEGLVVLDVTSGDITTLPRPDELALPWDLPPDLWWLAGEEELVVLHWRRPWLMDLSGAAGPAPYRGRFVALAADPSGTVVENDYPSRRLLTWRGDEVVRGRPVTTTGQDAAVTTVPDPAGRGEPSGTTGPVVPLREATRVWFLVSLQTFGGPAGQIAMMQRELVDERRWIGQRRFLHALSFCTLLPGPEAQQLSIYIGWLLNGIKGGLVAGVLFVLPGLAALLALSALYVGLGDTTAVEALFAGLAPAVLAIVAQAVWRLSGRALGHPVMVGVAVAAFVALAAFAVPFPAVVAAAAVIGWLLGRVAPHVLPQARHGDPADGPEPLIPDDALHQEPATRRHAATVLLVGLVLWAAPVVVFAVLTGDDSVFVDQALFFSGAALVTFGGAYAVLTYVAQQAVQVYGWLAPGEMVRGLALAESTPGPLIMVVQFVAFLGAYRDPGGLDPWVAGVLASLLTVWVTFVPCFVFIFLGAPYVERLRGNHALSSALAGITAAVVGVIANLALFFALATLFDDRREVGAGPVALDLPVLSSVDPLALGLLVLASLLLFWRGWGVLRVLGVCAVVGVVLGLLGAPV